MTEYHPVTEEELDNIFAGECEIGLSTIIDVLSRPDPLALLEAWLQKRYQKCDKIEVLEARSFVQQLHTNPDAVREQGIKEGWWWK